MDIETLALAKGYTNKQIKKLSVNGIKGDKGDPGKDAVIDTTLSNSGEAADAKVVGNEISSLKEELNELQNGGYVADQQQIGQKVNAWLDEHPEATTTVQDYSLELSKFTENAKKYIVKDYVTPQMFGAVGDGITDDTTAFQSAIDYCGSHGIELFAIGRYLISSTLTIKNSGLHILGKYCSIVMATDNEPIIKIYDPEHIYSMHSFIIDGLGLSYKNQQFVENTNAFGLYFECMVYRSKFSNISVTGAYCGIGNSKTINESLWGNTWENINISKFSMYGLYFPANSGAPNNLFNSIYLVMTNTDASGIGIYLHNQATCVINNVEVNGNPNGAVLLSALGGNIVINQINCENYTAVSTSSTNCAIHLANCNADIGFVTINEIHGTNTAFNVLYLYGPSVVNVNRIIIYRDMNQYAGYIYGTIVHEKSKINVTHGITDALGGGGVYLENEISGGLAGSNSPQLKLLESYGEGRVIKHGEYVIKTVNDNTLYIDENDIFDGSKFTFRVLNYDSKTLKIHITRNNGAWISETLSFTEGNVIEMVYVHRPYLFALLVYVDGALKYSKGI